MVDTIPTFPNFNVSESDVAKLSSVFQQGVQIDIQTGADVQSLLTEQWGLDAAYVRSRISSIFLNGKPVDDYQTAVVEDGATLALSSAMPGLVGAIMRSGGKLAGMRSGITHQGGSCGQSPKSRTGQIRLKLFNLLIDEIGLVFLLKGFRVKAAALAAAFPDRFSAGDDHMVQIVARPLSGKALSSTA